ncbi:MAG: hypothetical protein ACKO90_30705, partial [Microcystis panniformis]
IVYLVFGADWVQVSDQGLDLDSPQSGQNVVQITGDATSTITSPQSGNSLSSWSGSSKSWYAIAASNATNKATCPRINVLCTLLLRA